MNSKQRAYLKGLAQTIQPILNIGKSSLTPEFTESVAEALEARELIKISVLKNCLDDPREIAAMLGERTHSQVVQVIGRKIVLYKELGVQALEQFRLDKVLVMPNNKPGYKDISNEVTTDHRVNMIKLAIDGIKGLEYSDFELRRPGITYTSDTLEALHELYPDVHWYFIMGGDSIMYFDHWHRPDIISRHATLLVTTRSGASEDMINDKIASLHSLFPASDIRREYIHQHDISSSDIRAAVRSGEDIRDMVPDSVITYIRDNGLYHV